MSVLLRFQREEIKKMWTFAIFQSEEIKKMWTFSSPQPKIYHNIFYQKGKPYITSTNKKEERRRIILCKKRITLYKKRITL